MALRRNLMGKYRKYFVSVCLTLLLVINSMFGYAEQRITNCNYVDDDDCFAGENFFTLFAVPAHLTEKQ